MKSLDIFKDKVVQACTLIGLCLVIVFFSWGEYTLLTFAGLIALGWFFKSAIVEIKKDWEGQ